MLQPLQKILSPLGKSRGNTFYLWKALFGTAQAAPMPSSYNVDIGTLDKVLDGSNLVSVASGKLDFAGLAAVNFTNPAYIGKSASGAGFSFPIGRVFAFNFEVKANTARPVFIGLSNSNSPSSATNMGIYFVSGGNAGVTKPSGPGVGYTVFVWTVGSYRFRLLALTDGFAMFGTGGALGSTWKLLWVDHESTPAATVYPSFQGVSQVDYEVDYAALVDAQVFPLLSSNYALAVFNITSFNQVQGANTVVNGDFSSWTGTAPNRNPNSWSVSGETGTDPELTEVGPTEGHGGVGTGAFNLFTTATANTPVITQTGVYNATGLWTTQLTLTKKVQGAIRVQAGPGTIGQISVEETRKFLHRGVSSQSLTIFGAAVAPTDATGDDVSTKPFTTLNPTQTMPSADGQIDLHFTAPSSPVVGDSIHLFYRMTAAGDEMNNCFDLNATKDTATGYTINLDSYSGGTKTNRVTTSGVGAQPLKVKFEGNDHRIFRLNGATWTLIGSVFTNVLFNTNVLTSIAYDPGFTVTRWAGYRYENSLYDAILDQL